MSKLIIVNDSKSSDRDVLAALVDVVGRGKISGEGDKAQYCYISRYSTPPVVIYASKNKASDKFYVSDKHLAGAKGDGT